MTISEEIRNIEAELAAINAEYDAAQVAYDEYEQNPENWKAPDYSHRLAELHEAICMAARKGDELAARLRAAKAKMAAATPMGRFFAEMQSRNK